MKTKIITFSQPVQMSEDDTKNLSIRITDMLVELGYVKDCIDTDDKDKFEVQDIITEAIKDCNIRGRSELIAASIADNMMRMGLQTYSWDLDYEVRTDLENRVNQKILQFKKEKDAQSVLLHTNPSRITKYQSEESGDVDD